MAQPIPSHSIGHPAHAGHSHHTLQSLHPIHHGHHAQHNSSSHTALAHDTMRAASSSHSNHHKPGQDNDEETIARKKKNADAQAAFRQRRQTYIKSLEDTVTELKCAVTEMEAIVKVTSGEAKILQQQVELLETRLSAYESGEFNPGHPDQQQHCKCCSKLVTQDFHPRLTTTSRIGQHQNKSLATPSTSALTVNSDTNRPAPSGPSIVTPPSVTPQEGVSRDWSTRQAIPSIFQSDPSCRSSLHHHSAHDSSNDSSHQSKSSDYPRNVLHHSSSSLHNSSYPRSNCDLALFAPFGAPENNSMPHFYSVPEGNHGSSGNSSSPNGVCSSLELGSHSNHLQPIMSHSYDRSPPLRQPHSFTGTYSPIGPQPFDAHHSGTISSPRTWTSHNSHHHPTDPESHSRSHLDDSPKPGFYPIDGSVADSGPSGFRMHHDSDERSNMRSADYIPSLDLRSVPQSYPIIPSLSSPSADTAVGYKDRGSSMKRQREWGSGMLDSPHDTREADNATSAHKASGAIKLNGIPAKVARCNETVLLVTKVVSKAKEEAKAVTAASSATISAAHHSASPNSTVSNGFSNSPNHSHDTSKFQRMKPHPSAHPIVSSTSALAPP